jgi:hypothetical protein
MISPSQYQQLAAQGVVVVGWNAPGRGTGDPGNRRSGGTENCTATPGRTRSSPSSRPSRHDQRGRE